MGLGLSSGKQSSKSAGTQTTTPTAPSFITEPWQAYAEKAKGLLDPVAMPSAPAGPSPIQKTAFSMAPSLGLLKDVNLDPYMSPYTKDVIDTSTSDLDRARRIALVGNSAGSTAGGSQAWMGDRAGVADAETNRGFLDRVSSMAAALRAQAFENAQKAAQGDIENQRSNISLLSDLGDKEKAALDEASPMGQYLKRLAEFAATLGKIPSELFTGQVTDASSKGSGMSFGANAGINF